MTRSSSFITIQILALLVLALLVAEASAGETLVDQEFPASTGIAYSLDYPGDYMAQTFTVRNSGVLSSVGIRVGLGGYNHYKPPVDSLLVRLVGTDGTGAPDVNQTLASRIYQWYEIPEYSGPEVKYADFDLTPWDIQVSKGEVLAIALSSNQTAYDSTGKTNPYEYHYYAWHTALNDVHPGGDFYLYSPKLFGPVPHKWIDSRRQPDGTYKPTLPRDMGFRVLITVPEPASCVLLVGVSGWMMGRRSWSTCTEASGSRRKRCWRRGDV